MVAVTRTGRRVLRESHRRMVAAFTRVLEGWSDEDVNALSSGLERLREDFARLSAAHTSHQKEAA
jgi:DNA-binding MarR family transcriptional regulator